MEKQAADHADKKQNTQKGQAVTQLQSEESLQKKNQVQTDGPSHDSAAEDGQIKDIQNKLQSIEIENGDQQAPTQAEKHSNDEEAEQQEEYYTRDFIQVNRNSINFNKATLFPGSIDEIEVIINIKQDAFRDLQNLKENLPLRIIALCNQARFNDLDEYVFSVRDNDRFEYFEQVVPILNKNKKIYIKVAVKIPIVHEPQTIEGTLSLQLLSTVPIFFPITAKCQVPQIVCLKELYDIQQDVGLIKIPAKKNMRMPPLPFKNLSSYNFLLQADTDSVKDFSQRAFDVNVSTIISCSANSPFFVNIQLKPNYNYKGTTPKTDIIRKVLVLKVKNSSVYFSYPIEVYVFESSNGSSVS